MKSIIEDLKLPNLFVIIIKISFRHVVRLRLGSEEFHVNYQRFNDANIF